MIATRTKQTLGALVGIVVVLVLLSAGIRMLFLRDWILAWALFTWLASKAWKRLRQTAAVPAVAAWHGGQLVLVVFLGLILTAVCLAVIEPFANAYAGDIIEQSSIPRLGVLLLAYVIVGTPATLFGFAWTWFGARRRV